MNNTKTTSTVATITTDGNQHKLLSVGELRFEIHVRSDAPLCCCCCCYCFMLLLSWNCHCACATTDKSQQQQCYTVTTIIKQLMITKILNNICRFTCMLLLLLGLSYVIWKKLLQSKAWNIWQENLLWLIDPLVNWAWISGRPLHHLADHNQAWINWKPWYHIILTYSRMHIHPWQTDTHPNWAYIQAKPLHPISFTYCLMHICPWQMDPPVEHRSKENHYTQ